jgi:hypothetical protein
VIFRPRKWSSPINYHLLDQPTVDSEKYHDLFFYFDVVLSLMPCRYAQGVLLTSK